MLAVAPLNQLPSSQRPQLVSAASHKAVKQHRTEHTANKGSTRMFSKASVRKATTEIEKTLDTRQSTYSAARLQSGNCMLDAEPRSVLDKVL